MFNSISPSFECLLSPIDCWMNVICKMPRPRPYKVHKVLAMLEDDSEFDSAPIYISPPVDPDCSDKDSGNDEYGTVDNFTTRQLEAEAEVTIIQGAALRRIGMTEDDDISCTVSENPITTTIRTAASPEINQVKQSPAMLSHASQIGHPSTNTIAPSPCSLPSSSTRRSARNVVKSVQ
jgi:hypothetical protein